MQYTITINQAKALEWGLNASQALLFAFVYECPSWARVMRTPDGDFHALSKAKILEELPLLTDKPDTAYRLLKQLQAVGLIDVSHTQTITLVRVTQKGKGWNRKVDGSEKYPSQPAQLGKISDHPRKKIRAGSENNPSSLGNESEQGRKNIRQGSEKSPTNQVTSNQVTSDQGMEPVPAERDRTQPDDAGQPDTRSPTFGIRQMLAHNPHNLSEALLTDWVKLRKAKRAGVSETAWSALNTEIGRCMEHGLAPDLVLAEAVSAGWQGFRADWILRRLKAAAPTSRHHEFDQRDYTHGLQDRGDGTYAF
ncbi:hypothetical protein [Pseudomonas sp. Marseille-QA0892]